MFQPRPYFFIPSLFMEGLKTEPLLYKMVNVHVSTERPEIQ